jgi:hypothetical protein
MAIALIDEHLESQIAAESRRRGHKTLARTLAQLVTERLMILESERPEAAKDVNGAGAGEETDRDATAPASA